MKTFTLLFLLIISIVFSTQAHAAAQWCKGTIEHSYIAKDGTLYIFGTWRNQHTAVCNVNTARDGVSVEVCKSWLSMIITGKAMKTPMVVFYGEALSCAEIPQYSAAPGPGYIMLSK